MYLKAALNSNFLMRLHADDAILYQSAGRNSIFACILVQTYSQ